MSTDTKGAGGRRPYDANGYDADLINTEALAVCDHYLMERRREGRRYVYRCPDCGKLDFEVEPVKGLAGCFNPACHMPKTTNALGIISHLEGLKRRGAEFIRCMEKGYEILGLALPSDAGRTANGRAENGAPKRAKESASSVESVPQQHGSEEAVSPRPGVRKWVRQNEAGLESGDPDPADASSELGSDRGVGVAQPPEERPGRPAPQGERANPIEAYFEGPNGEMIPTEAVIIEESAAIMELPEADADVGPTEAVEERLSEEPPDPADDQGPPEGGAPQQPPHGPEESTPGDDVRETRLFGRTASPAFAAERELRHAVYERLLALCPMEKRDADFFEGRGLDHRTITQGRFGSISAKRSRWAADKLREDFGEEDLLKVPGFYLPEANPEGGPERGPRRMRFSLYGDYALIPYHDAQGYITTVEGRLIGEPKNKRDKKYKALLGSGVHLYVHPHFEPGEVVAFCEGAIGAMVAARYGVPVAAIKGFRNYKVSGRERGDEDTVLSELGGVDFAGRTVVYIPDVDVKPRSREEVMEAVPAACEWLIARQGGVPKVALLPEDAKDLDAWLLSLPEARRVEAVNRLLSGAVSLGEWTDFPQDDRRPEQVPGQGRSEGAQPPTAPACGKPGGKRDLLDDDDTTGGTPGSPSQAEAEAPTGELRWDSSQRPSEGGTAASPRVAPADRSEAPGGSSPAAHDPERARKGPMHPAMARWYEVARYDDEQIAAARQHTVMRKSTGKGRPPVRDTPVRLPRWTPGDVVLALATAFAVAVVLYFLAYAVRAQGGSIAAVGELVTWPPWWLELALYAWAGALAANWMAGRRHRERRRQLQAHLRGEG